MFVMISGMFNLSSIQNYTRTDGIKKMTKKTMRIVYALIFWSIINIFFIDIAKVILKHDTFDFSKILRIPYMVLSIEPWSHLWYLYLIVGLYLFTPVLKIFVDNASKKDFEYFLILYFIIGLCIPTWNTLAGYVNKVLLFAPDIPFSELTGYVGYYIAGFYFSKYSLKKATNVIIIIIGIISLFISIIGTGIIANVYGLFISAERGFYNRLGPFYMFVTFATFISFKILFENIHLVKVQISIIKHISKCTFGIYLVHWMVIPVVNYIGINSALFNPIISIPLIALFVMLCSYIVTFIIKQVPILKKNVV
jgi:surface polysaccharide O-acyltransferase-like enzyme